VGVNSSSYDMVNSFINEEILIAIFQVLEEFGW
jgi:hypothetical protein